MQASSALKETRLPRAVALQSEMLREKYGSKTAPDGNPDPNADSTVPPSPSADPDPKPPSAARSPEDDNDPVYWKNRFHATEGMLRKERNDRRLEVQKFNQQLEDLNAQLDELRSNATAQTDATVSDDELGEWFTPEEIEALGEDEARAKVKVIKKAVKSQLGEALKKEIKPLQDRQAQERADALADAKVAFIDELTSLIPTWEQLDADPDFIAWCAERNDDGIVRQEVIDRHISRLDAKAMAKMCNQFLKTKEVPTPPITPNGSGATPPSDPPKNPKGLTAPTNAEIKDFYKRAGLGKVKPAERAEFDARMKLRTGG